MTSEEIEQHAETLLLLLTDGYTLDEKRRTENVLRSLVSQAYEEAIKATCPHCARGIPVELIGRDQCPDLAEVGSLDEDDGETYIHRRDDRELFANYLCDAASIRALKDSLAQEPVASS